MMQANEEKVASLVGNLTKIMSQLAQEVGASSEADAAPSEYGSKESKPMMTCSKCGHEESCPGCSGETKEEEAPTEPAQAEEADEEENQRKEPSIIGRLMVLKRK